MDKLNIIFLGGKQAGVIGLLTVLAAKHYVRAVVTVSSMVEEIAQAFDLYICHSVKQDEIRKLLLKTDLLVSVHSREIIPNDILEIPKYGGINVHPCLSQYKGKYPIHRFLNDGATQASVGVHRMTEEVDYGETLTEMFVDVDRSKINTVFEVYNILYPYYSLVLLGALKKTIDS